MRYLFIAGIPFFALLFDAILGDPRTNWHPVVLMGKVITFWEKRLHHKDQTPKEQLIAGVLLVICTLMTVGIVTSLLLLVASYIGFYAYIIMSSLLLYITITPNALARDASEIAELLRQGNLSYARQRLSWIVGRDTDHLTRAEISRATIETVAENIIDGIISPIFYFLLAGPIGAILYRASNTMDSMVGYKNEQYLYFGRCAAKWDDLLNYIPARLTAFLLLIAGMICGDQYRNGWAVMKRDAAQHPSPNGGYAEATVAGMLGIRLGGMNYYQGEPEFRAYMGDEVVEMNETHIRRTIRLMYVVTLLMVVGESLILCGWEWR